MKDKTTTSGSKRPRLSEEEKKKKFGDKYDPNYSQNKSKDGYEGPKKESKLNDWEWYALSEEIAKSIGGFSYSDLTGVPKNVTITTATSKDTDVSTGVWLNQNVMKVGYINAQFATADVTSSLSKAATQLYVFLRHVNSGARNYEPADVMAVVLAMREIYSEFFEIKRALGIARYFNFFNRAIPEVLEQALQIDFDDLKKNIAIYRGELNILANTINSIAIPRYFKAFERAALISSVVFSDSDSMRGQFYVYDRMGYYTFSGTSETTGSALIFNTKAAIGTVETIAIRLDRLNNMVAAILEDTDANTITGDVLHAFKDTEVYILDQIPDDYMVVPVFNEDLLAQVENSISLVSCGMQLNYADAGTLNVTQAQGRLVWQPTFTKSTSGNLFKLSHYLFNSHKDEVDYRDNLEWSRLLFTINVSGGANRTMTITSTGLELVVEHFIFSAPNTTPIAIIQFNPSTAQMMALEQFDWHPTVYSTTTIGALSTGADLKKFVWIEESLIAKIHDAANNASFTSLDLYALRR